jgi:uncharacterized repeat protein (TIGR02543 family)
MVMLAVALALTLGVGSASARSLVSTQINVTVVGNGTVTSFPPGINCTNTGSPACSAVFTTLGTIVLTATPDPGWTFDGWTCGGGTVADDTCQITPDTSMNTFHQVIATFSLAAPPGPSPSPGNSLTVEVLGKGTVTSHPGGIKCGNGEKSCYVSFTGSSSVDLTADPADGWTFDGWGLSGDDTMSCSGTGACSVPTPTTGEQVVTASFSKKSGSSTKTLSVTAPLDLSGEGGNVHSYVPGDGFPIDCGSDLVGGSVGACSWTVPSGSTLTVRETPDAGYVFNGWSGACDGTNVACTVEMSDDRDLGATWHVATDQQLLTITISGQGTVEGGGIDCSGPATCTKFEPSGSTIVLKAKAKNGSVLSAWTGDCGGTADTCTVTMDAARSVTATFVAAPVTLSVTVNGNGNVSGGSGAINCGNGADVCSASFALNATVTLIATPATGGTFVGWTGACGGSATTCTVLMSQSKSVTATFTGGAVGAGFALSVSVSGSGTVSGGGISCGSGATICSVNLAANTTVTLTATPAAGATFNGWGGACSGTVTTCTVVMNAAKSVTASFSSVGGGTTFLFAVSVTGSGTVTGGGISCGNGASACSATLPAGTTVTLTATPAGGATFSGWNGACTGTSPTCTVTMTSAKSVTATFTAAAPGTLSIVVNGKGTVSTTAGKCVGTGAQKTCVQHLKGKSATLTETPAAGQVFGGWGDACASASKKVKCTVTLTVARVVSATFTAAGGGGGGAAPVLTSRGLPIVGHTETGFRVTLRFNTTRAGLTRVRGLRAGRVLISFSLRVAAGPATIGPFQVTKPGLYTFEVRSGTRAIHWRSCLGRCGRLAPGPNFVLTREAPKVTRSGDVWSVTLHLRANLISAARVQAFRGTRKLVDQRFLARTGQILVGPFLLGPGSYTLRLTATDAYGRTRTLTWIVSLAR